jgi:hypothetical protein
MPTDLRIAYRGSRPRRLSTIYPHRKSPWPCLRISNSQARKNLQISTRRRARGNAIGRLNGRRGKPNGLAPDVATLAARDDGSSVFAELARAVDHVSRRPTTRRRPNAPTRTIGRTSSASATAMGSRRFRRRRRRSRSTSRPSKRDGAARRPEPESAQRGSRCRRCGSGSPRSRAGTQPPASRLRPIIPLCGSCCGAIAAPGGPPSRRKSRC